MVLEAEVPNSMVLPWRGSPDSVTSWQECVQEEEITDDQEVCV